MFFSAGMYTITKQIHKELGSLENARKFIEISIPNTLISYGEPLSSHGKKAFDKNKYKELVKKQILEKLIPYYGNNDKTNILLDSGGYQVSIGLLNRKYISEYTDSYAEFLEENPDLYDEAFTLDLPACPGFLETMDDIYKYNKESISKTIQLKSDVLDKVLFVSHFRIIENFRAWNKLIYEDKSIKYFKRFAIGGLVGIEEIISSVPFSLYLIGFLQILNYFKHYPEDKPDSIRFHVLGVSSSRSILFFYLVKPLLEKLYDIEIILSYDTSITFKKVLRARSIFLLLNSKNILVDVSLKYRDLTKTFKCGNVSYKPLKLLEENINDLIEQVKIDSLNKVEFNNPNDVYESEKSPFKAPIGSLIIGLQPYILHKVDKYLQEKASYLYDLFMSGNIYQFKLELSDVLTRMSGKCKKTKNLKQLESIYTNSMFSLLDGKMDTIDKLESIVETYKNNLTKLETCKTSPTWDLIL